MSHDPWTKAYESACSDTRLSDRDFRVYIAVRLRCGESGACWESTETIGTRAGNMSGKNAQRALSVLKKLHYLAETPDPSKKTGRRLTLDNPVLPPRTNPSHTQDSSVLPPRTVLSTNQRERSRTGSRTTKTSGSSSSSSSMDQAPQGGEEKPETETERLARSKAEGALVDAFPATSAEKIRATVAKFGPDVVAYGIKRFQTHGRGKGWEWFYGMCKNVKDEGGPPGEPAKPRTRAEHLAEVFEKRRAENRDKVAKRKEEGLPPFPPWDAVWISFDRDDPAYLESLAASPEAKRRVHQ